MLVLDEADVAKLPARIAAASAQRSAMEPCSGTACAATGGGRRQMPSSAISCWALTWA
jgi:hypothetical protein